MGIYFNFRGGLKFEEPLDPEFKAFFNYYVFKLSGNDPLQPYGTFCPWYINDENELACSQTKCGDHEVWLEYIASRFLTPFGIKASGALEYVVSFDPTDEEWKGSEKWYINTAQYVRFAGQDYGIMSKVLDEGKRYMKNANGKPGIAGGYYVSGSTDEPRISDC